MLLVMQMHAHVSMCSCFALAHVWIPPHCMRLIFSRYAAWVTVHSSRQGSMHSARVKALFSNRPPPGACSPCYCPQTCTSCPSSSPTSSCWATPSSSCSSSSVLSFSGIWQAAGLAAGLEAAGRLLPGFLSGGGKTSIRASPCSAVGACRFLERAPGAAPPRGGLVGGGAVGAVGGVEQWPGSFVRGCW